MKIAVIGAGAMGAGLAARFGPAGHRVVVSGRRPLALAPVAAAIGYGVRVSTMRDAVEEAEVVVLATPFAALGEVLGIVGGLEGRIVVDITNPVARDAQGRPVRLLPPHLSAAAHLSRRLPGARLVKAYCHVPSRYLRPGAQHEDGLPLAAFFCGDDPDATRQVAGLICDSGFAPVDLGRLEAALDIESGGRLHRPGLLPAPQAHELLRAGHPLWPRAA